MAERIEIITVTVPAATPIATPQSTLIPWREGNPERVEFRIPPGPSGLVGVALAHSGRKVIPKNAAEWLITDNEHVIWPLEEYPSNAKWTILAYNLDIYDHVFQVRMLLREIRRPIPQEPDPVDVEPPNEPAHDAEVIPDDVYAVTGDLP